MTTVVPKTPHTETPVFEVASRKNDTLQLFLDPDIDSNFNKENTETTRAMATVLSSGNDNVATAPTEPASVSVWHSTE